MLKKLIVAILICSCLGFLGYFFVYTTQGSEMAAHFLMDRSIDYAAMEYDQLHGNLADGLTFENLELKNIKNVPDGTSLRIQKIFFNLTSFNLDGVLVEADNIRLRLPDSDPIVLSGTFKEQQLELNIYSKGFSVTEVQSYLPDLKTLIPIKGEVNDIDLFITGHYTEPAVNGSFTIERFTYKGFELTDAPLAVDIRLKDIHKDIKLYGHVHMAKGELRTKRVLVNLEESNLNFAGLWDQPQINLKGNSKVEKIKIKISLKGTIEKPDLVLSSEPPQSRQRIMTMLATGKSWQSMDDAMEGNLNSAAVTKDFIDYFFFAGRSGEFAKRFGISDFSVTLNEGRKGIAAKKEISERLEVGYGIEQTVTDRSTVDVSQKLGGEYKVSDQVSVGLEREMKKTQSSDTFEEQVNQDNDKVMIKYKKSF